jgi:two-component system OmpR family response regulator
MPLALVVDDEPSVRALLEVTLRMEGYDIASAPDGETALELAARLRPDVMTLDVMMPDMDGWEVAARLEGSGIPIVLMSGLPPMEIQAAPGRVNVAAVMGKPFDINVFVDVVAQAIRDGAPDLVPDVDLRNVPARTAP